MRVTYYKDANKLTFDRVCHEDVNPSVNANWGGVTIGIGDKETAIQVRDALIKAYPLESDKPDMPEEPTEPGIYITQTNRCLLKSLTCWWRAMDKYVSAIDGFWCNGSNAARWDDVCRTLPASEFPLIRLNTER